MTQSEFYHESLYRTDDAMARLREFPVTVAGAGALGANLCETLARSGFGRLRVIDHDRVEERNLSTQPWCRGDIGSYKARLLSNFLYRAVGAGVEPVVQHLDEQNAGRLLKGAELVVDTLDNSIGRRAISDWCSRNGSPCLHAGLGDGYGEVIWNEEYRIPSPAGDDICDYPLARNLAMLTVSLAAEAVIRFAATGEKPAFTVTLGDLAVKPLG